MLKGFLNSKFKYYIIHIIITSPKLYSFKSTYVIFSDPQPNREDVIDSRFLPLHLIDIYFLSNARICLGFSC